VKEKSGDEDTTKEESKEEGGKGDKKKGKVSGEGEEGEKGGDTKKKGDKKKGKVSGEGEEGEKEDKGKGKKDEGKKSTTKGSKEVKKDGKQRKSFAWLKSPRGKKDKKTKVEKLKGQAGLVQVKKGEDSLERYMLIHGNNLKVFEKEEDVTTPGSKKDVISLGSHTAIAYNEQEKDVLVNVTVNLSFVIPKDDLEAWKTSFEKSVAGEYSGEKEEEKKRGKEGKGNKGKRY
jgi:hypothetical protein